MNVNRYITEPAKKIPVIAEADICVIGGSATGVFAAVRAARLGAKVILVERSNCFGGTATNGLVNVWHTLLDTENKKQIIAGLTAELLERIEPVSDRGRDRAGSHFFNPHEMKTELDLMLIENKVSFMLHTMYTGLLTSGSTISAVFVENKDGRGAIKADFFIDATGDGDLCRDLGIESYTHSNIQPPSACFLLDGDASDIDAMGIIRRYGDEVSLEKDWGWSCRVPESNGITMRADTHVTGFMLDRADDLTKAEVEGRRKMRALVKLLNKYGKEGAKYSNICSCSSIGIRETRHYMTMRQAKQDELLLGKRYDDNILNGTYNVDIHLADGSITFRHFDGSYNTELRDGRHIKGSWRKELGIADNVPVPTYYSLPFSCLVPQKHTNIIAAGRMINADIGSFGALRVMVNLNQIGEATGVAAYLALDKNIPVQELEGIKVAKTLSEGGSANLG